MSSELDELVELIEKVDIRNDVRIKGWECILGLTGTEEGIKAILTESVICLLLSHLNHSQDSSTHSIVYKCLINISSNDYGALKLLAHQKDFVPRLLETLSDSSSDSVDSICYVLNNLSSHGSLCEDPFNDKLNLLTKLFLSHDKLVREKYRFISMIFSNITKISDGRKFFLQNNEHLSEYFSVCANPSESAIRRLGVSLTLRNCCFETDSYERLLLELSVLPTLLRPLMGSEEYKEEEMESLPIDCQYLEKEREPHPNIRRTLVQALCLLCYTEEGWNFLKRNGVFYVARELHNWERDEGVAEAVETLLLYLMVEDYKPPDVGQKDVMLKGHYLEPSHTDIVKDLPDFLV